MIASTTRWSRPSGGWEPDMNLSQTSRWALALAQNAETERVIRSIEIALGIHIPGHQGWTAWYDAAARGEWR